jgi:hypothetical protein
MIAEEKRLAKETHVGARCHLPLVAAAHGQVVVAGGHNRVRQLDVRVQVRCCRSSRPGARAQAGNAKCWNGSWAR